MELEIKTKRTGVHLFMFEQRALLDRYAYLELYWHLWRWAGAFQIFKEVWSRVSLHLPLGFVLIRVTQTVTCLGGVSLKTFVSFVFKKNTYTYQLWSEER